MLDWFNLVHSIPFYEQPELDFVEKKGDELDKIT